MSAPVKTQNNVPFSDNPAFDDSTNVQIADTNTSSDTHSISDTESDTDLYDDDLDDGLEWASETMVSEANLSV